ncbi:MAG: tetratricopeptide repeat protein, partial [Verrucomicrobia bacterium]|nr:tetratricopeptide repeat protein [Verrucomicrobiota bacterium]
LLLLRALRYIPCHARALGNLARYHAIGQEFDQALLLYRLAAACDDKEESWWLALFQCARHLGRQDSVVSLLKERAEENVVKSIDPLRTACQVLAELHRTSEALGLIDHALARRPDDAPLQLFAAETYAEIGDLARAEVLLSAVQSGVREAERQRIAAHIARLRGNLELTRQHLEAALEAAPAALDLHDQLADLLLDTAGLDAAVAHIHAACQRFPFNTSLLERLVGWTHRQDAAQAETHARRLLELSPTNAWAHRELTRILLDLGRAPEALRFARQAIALQRSHPHAWVVLGLVHKALGQIPEATAAFWDALDRDVDNTLAIAELLDEKRPFNERAHHAEQMFDRLMRQHTQGFGIQEWHARARTLFSRERLRHCLQQLHGRHAQVWQAWSALVTELLEQEQLDDARKLAETACERFPFNAEVWFVRARCHHARGEGAFEIEALERIRQISPTQSKARRRLAIALERAGRPEDAEQTLHEAVRHDPGDAYNRGGLADILWKQGKREEAYAALWQAVRLDPEYDWAWDQIERWPAALGRYDEALGHTRAFVDEHPQSVRPVLSLLAQLYAGGYAYRTEALNVAAALVQSRPRLVQGHDWHAYLLARAQRYDEALRACVPPVFEGGLPPVLQFRQAWVQWHAGRPAQAIESMLRLVTADPANAWNFEQLTRWALESENAAVALYASAGWVKLRENDADASYQRGQALTRAGQPGGARTAYRRVLELAPGHEGAALALIEDHLRRGERDEAEAFLNDLERTHSRAFVSSCRCLVIARTAAGSARTDRHALQRALQEFGAVCTDPNTDSRHFWRAANALVSARWEDAVAGKARDLAFKKDALPETAELWVKHTF